MFLLASLRVYAVSGYSIESYTPLIIHLFCVMGGLSCHWSGGCYDELMSAMQSQEVASVSDQLRS